MKKIFILLLPGILVTINLPAQSKFRIDANKSSLQAGDDKNFAKIDSAGNLLFTGEATYRISGNKYAILCNEMPQEGLFMNENLQRWEFRDEKAFPFFTINNSNYGIAAKGGIIAGDDKNNAKIDSAGNLQFTGEATYRISGNKYAILCNGMPQEGLFMNENLQRWEFRDEKAFPFFTINNSNYGIAAKGGIIAGDDKNNAKIDSAGNLQFTGEATYRISGNKYAILCNDMPQEGLFMNENLQRWEFRDEKAFPFFTINNSSHDIATAGGLQVGNSISTVAGNIRFNAGIFQGFDGTIWRNFTTTPGGRMQDTVVNNSNTMQIVNDKLQQQINTLQEQINELKILMKDQHHHE